MRVRSCSPGPPRIFLERGTYGGGVLLVPVPVPVPVSESLRISEPLPLEVRVFPEEGPGGSVGRGLGVSEDKGGKASGFHADTWRIQK